VLDTIVLLLSKDMYQIIDPNKFSPCARWATERTSFTRGMRSIQNPTRKEQLAGIYKPRLTLFHHAHTNSREIVLKIELSLPKLLFGNNFQELHLKDFPAIIQTLTTALSSMGVLVDPKLLAHAPVSAIHYSKNILLTDGSTPYHYINKIKEANISAALDVNQTDYRNEGHSYKWHCNTYEVVFYDKIKDLEMAQKSSKRSLEKDGTIQAPLVRAFQRRKKWEILRMEVRLNKRQKIKSLFAKLGLKANCTLKALFKPSISKKVLLHYTYELESKRPALLDFKAVNDKSLLTTLLFNNPTFGPKRILELFGLRKALETMNLRELRTMLTSCSARSWYRLMADATEVQLPHAHKPFEIIRKQLMIYRPLRITID
jgi:hypothetical protein